MAGPEISVNLRLLRKVSCIDHNEYWSLGTLFQKVKHKNTELLGQVFPFLNGITVHSIGELPLDN